MIDTSSGLGEMYALSYLGIWGHNIRNHLVPVWREVSETGSHVVCPNWGCCLLKPAHGPPKNGREMSKSLGLLDSPF